MIFGVRGVRVTDLELQVGLKGGMFVFYVSIQSYRFPWTRRGWDGKPGN